MTDHDSPCVPQKLGLLLGAGALLVFGILSLLVVVGTEEDPLTRYPLMFRAAPEVSRAQRTMLDSVQADVTRTLTGYLPAIDCDHREVGVALWSKRRSQYQTETHRLLLDPAASRYALTHEVVHALYASVDGQTTVQRLGQTITVAQRSQPWQEFWATWVAVRAHGAPRPVGQGFAVAVDPKLRVAATPLFYVSEIMVGADVAEQQENQRLRSFLQVQQLAFYAACEDLAQQLPDELFWKTARTYTEYRTFADWEQRLLRQGPFALFYDRLLDRCPLFCRTAVGQMTFSLYQLNDHIVAIMHEDGPPETGPELGYGMLPIVLEVWAPGGTAPKQRETFPDGFPGIFLSWKAGVDWQPGDTIVAYFLTDDNETRLWERRLTTVPVLRTWPIL